MSVAIMWTTESCHCWCCHVMSDDMGQRKLCFIGHLRSYPTRSVRWRVWVQSESWLQSFWMWEFTARLQWRNKSFLYLKNTNNLAVLRLWIETLCELIKHLIQNHVFCMFYLTVEIYLCLMQISVYICVGLAVRKSIYIHCFDSFVSAEVIVA